MMLGVLAQVKPQVIGVVGCGGLSARSHNRALYCLEMKCVAVAVLAEICLCLCPLIALTRWRRIKYTGLNNGH